jgi:hypothetical protein
MNGDILVNHGAAFHLGRTLEKLYELEWDLLYLGDGLNSAPGIFPQRFGHLTTANSISTWTAVCYNQTAYQTILEIIPEKRKSTTKWCSKGGGITTCHEKLDKKFLAVPSVVTRLAGKPIEKKLNKLED